MPTNQTTRTNCGCTPNPLDSGNWESESSAERSSTTVPSADGSGSGSPPPASCEVALSVSPVAVACSSSYSQSVFTVTGEATNDDCGLSLAMPDGRVVEGLGYLTTQYTPNVQECGEEIEFELTGQCAGKPPVTIKKKAKVFKVVFTLELWNPKVSGPDKYDYRALTNGTVDFPNMFGPDVPCLISVPYFPEGGGIFTAEGRVKINVEPPPEGDAEQKIANDLCKQWSLEIVQAILPPEIWTARRKGGVEEVHLFNPPLPYTDGQNEDMTPVMFLAAGDIKTRALGDSPNLDFRCDWVLTGKPDPGVQAPPFVADLEFCKRANNFVNWLVVFNAKTKEERVLAWSSWMLDWAIDVDIVKVPPPVAVKFTWKTKKSELTGSGNGPTLGHPNVIRAPKRSAQSPSWHIKENP